MKTRLSFLLVLALLVILVGSSAGVAAAQAESAITIGPDSLSATYATQYSQQLTASGGTEPYTFSLASGSLPYGITLSSNGLLSGYSEYLPGDYPITVQVTDANSVTASRDYTFVLDKAMPIVTAHADINIYWNHPFSLSAEVKKERAPGYFIPAQGTVAFTVDGNPVPGCQAVTLSSGIAPCPGVSMDLSQGAHTLKAEYTPAGGSEAYFYPATGSGTLTVLPGSYSIFGYVFEDKDNDGQWDSGIEYGLEGWTINLMTCDGNPVMGTGGNIIGPAFSDMGSFRFTNVPGGQCVRVSEVVQTGWQPTTATFADFTPSMDVFMDYFGNYYPTITFSPADDYLPSGSSGVPYSQAITASGGASPYTFTISQGVLPAGLTLSADGIISGTPTVAGAYSFTVQAEEANHATGRRLYNLIIKTDGVFTLTSSSNPSNVGDQVTFTVSATGEAVNFNNVEIPPVGGVTFYADGTAIEGCSNLILNYRTGGFGDYPVTCATAALTEGTHQITATYTDYFGGIYNPPALALTQVVGQPVSYTISGLIFDDSNQNGTRDADENTLYSSGPVYLDQGCDGVADYTAWVASGGYVFSGIPGGECYRITIELEESGWQQTTQLADFGLSGDTTLDIGFHYPDITFSPSPSELPTGNVGVEYYQQFTASGGTEPYIYGIVNSSLPEGLTLSADDGAPILSGTPTVAGYYGFTLGTADAHGAQRLVVYELIIKADGDFTFTSSSNPSAPGEAVTFTVSATGDVVLPGRVDPIPLVGLVTFAADGAPIEGCSDLYLNLGYDLNGYFGIGNYPATCTTAALEAGTHTITATYTDNLGIGLYNIPSLALAQVVEQSDATPPDITPTIVGILGQNGWYSSDVSLTWLAADGESEITSSSGCDPVTINSDQTATDYTCTATSAGGTNSVTINIGRDATAPVVSVTGVMDGGSYYIGSVPQAACSTTDATSGVATEASLALSGGDTLGLGSFTATCSGAVDNAGNAASPVSASYTVLPVADLNITKIDSKDPVKPGARLVYTLLVSNAGPNDALSLTLQDTLDRNTTYVSVSAPSGWTCRYSNGKVTCTGASLASGSSATIQIVVTVNKTAKIGKELVNNAGVSSATYDPMIANNTVVQKTLVIK